MASNSINPFLKKMNNKNFQIIMDISTLNWFAIIVATLSNFLFGGLWYSPILFGKVWMQENNFTDEDMKKGNMPKIFGLIFLFSFVMAFNLAMFLNDAKTITSWVVIAGFLAGFGWVAICNRAI
jgi:UDP-N-acetylmuramyl pentapeptide phosphotransferase/UDP-N-acetylglucosamine-1-phosphate transferase